MERTIAAISTPQGNGGIAVIRISGNDAVKVADKVFFGSKRLADCDTHTVHYGFIKNEKGEKVDEVLATVMLAPKTFTREDVVEISTHGGSTASRAVLDTIIRAGAYMAEPGEFTKRAFLNGRLDLSQAEAVIDMIRAKTDKSFDVAVSQLEGRLSLKVEEIRQKLLDLLVDITVNIDYPDEDIEEMTYEKLEESIVETQDMIEKLLATSSTGKMIREGIKIAIVGKPNVGKSSLMNGLLKETRAIVTDIPGTTRDTIEEVLSIRNIPVYLVDTAGIRETSDKVEKMGIEKSKEAFNQADFILFLLDGSRPLEEEDLQIMELLKERKSLVLINKRDLGEAISIEEIAAKLPASQVIEASLLKGQGITEIEDAVEDLVYGGEIVQKESMMVNNVRHIELLQQAVNSLTDALHMSEMREALDFIEVDVKNAYERLGEIIGETVSDDIINEVFARFCLGK